MMDNVNISISFAEGINEIPTADYNRKKARRFRYYENKNFEHKLNRQNQISFLIEIGRT